MPALGGLTLWLVSAVSVTVAPSPYAADLSARLSEDLGPGRVTEGGDVLVRLQREGSGLQLEVLTGRETKDPDRTSPLGVVLSRRLGLEDGLRPALRLAALLVVEVVERLERSPEGGTETATAASDTPPRPNAVVDAPAVQPPPPAAVTEPAEPVDPPPPDRRISLSLGATIGQWAVPSAPRVGVVAGATYRLDDWRFGLEGGAEGLCCTFATVGRVEGRSLRWWAAVTATYALLVRSWFGAGPMIGVGLGFENMTTLATAFAGEPTEETRRSLGAMVRGGLYARAALDLRWSVVLRGGVELRTNRLVSRLPPPFERAEVDVDAGRVLPWGTLAVVFAAF